MDTKQWIAELLNSLTNNDAWMEVADLSFESGWAYSLFENGWSRSFADLTY